MSPTEVRKKLSIIIALKKEIKVLEMQIEELNVAAEGAGGFKTEFIPLTGYVESKVENIVIKIIEKKEYLERKGLELLERETEGEQLIDLLPDKYSTHRTVLRLKYVLQKSLSNIATMLNYSERQIKRYEWNAVCMISKIFNSLQKEIVN